MNDPQTPPNDPPPPPPEPEVDSPSPATSTPFESPELDRIIETPVWDD